MRGFRQVLQDTDLSDMGYGGIKYTLPNRRKGQDFTKERLDRVCEKFC